MFPILPAERSGKSKSNLIRSYLLLLLGGKTLCPPSNVIDTMNMLPVWFIDLIGVCGRDYPHKYKAHRMIHLRIGQKWTRGYTHANIASDLGAIVSSFMIIIYCRRVLWIRMSFPILEQDPYVRLAWRHCGCMYCRLDGKHVVFGKVVSGMEVVRQMEVGTFTI